MLKFFGLGQTKPARPDASAPVSVMPSTQQHTNIQRELARVVLKDTLRMQGIPASWIGCEVTVMPRRSTDEQMFVHLIIKHWNEALLRFAPALQQQFILGLDRFDPTVDHSNYMVVWRFSPDCDCPFTQMPDPAFWSPGTEGSKPVSAVQPVVQPGKPKFQLPPSDRDDLPPDFAPTEVGPLR